MEYLRLGYSGEDVPNLKEEDLLPLAELILRDMIEQYKKEGKILNNKIHSSSTSVNNQGII